MGKLEIAPLRAEIFVQDGRQTIRLPESIHMEGSEVVVRRDGDKLILEPVAADVPRTQADLDAMWARIDALLGGAFPDRDQPPAQERDFGW